MSDGQTKRINVVMPITTHTELKVTAAQQGTTMAAFILQAIQEKLERSRNSGTD